MSELKRRHFMKQALGWSVVTLLGLSARVQGSLTMSGDKYDVLQFVGRLLQAARDDALSDSERLEAILGIEVQEWTSQAISSRGQKFTEKVAKKMRTNVRIFDATSIAARVRYAIRRPNPWWTVSLHIDGVASQTCVSPKDTELLIGKPDARGPAPHGSRAGAGTSIYLVKAPTRDSEIWLGYVRGDAGVCLESIDFSDRAKARRKAS